MVAVLSRLSFGFPCLKEPAFSYTPDDVYGIALRYMFVTATSPT